MSDESTASRIEQLVAEEHDLRAREQADSSDTAALDEDRERLRAGEVELDRCWDLLRQRRALRDAGGDPDDAQARAVPVNKQPAEAQVQPALPKRFHKLFPTWSVTPANAAVPLRKRTRAMGGARLERATSCL